MKSANLNFLEPAGPLQACNGTDLPLHKYNVWANWRDLNVKFGGTNSYHHCGAKPVWDIGEYKGKRKFWEEQRNNCGCVVELSEEQAKNGLIFRTEQWRPIISLSETLALRKSTCYMSRRFSCNRSLNVQVTVNTCFANNALIKTVFTQQYT